MAGITPWKVGQRSPVWMVQLIPDSGTYNVAGMTTANFAMTFRNTDAAGVVDTAGTGIFFNLQAASGKTPASIQYELSAADVTNAGNYNPLVLVTTPAGRLDVVDLGPWRIDPL